MTQINGTTAGIEHLRDRLNEENTAQSIDRLLNRIDTLEKALENLTTMMQQGPGLMAMGMDMVDEGYKKAAGKGISIENRLNAALQIAEKLTAPAMVEKLDNLLTFADQAPGIMAMTMDAVDEGYRKAGERGVSVENHIGNALTMAEKLTAPEMSQKLDGLLTIADQAPGIAAMLMDTFDEEMRKVKDMGFDAELLNTGKLAAQSLSEAKAEPVEKVGGIFGLMRALKDPDRQKAMGFLMQFAKKFGQKL